MHVISILKVELSKYFYKILLGQRQSKRICQGGFSLWMQGGSSWEWDYRNSNFYYCIGTVCNERWFLRLWWARRQPAYCSEQGYNGMSAFLGKTMWWVTGSAVPISNCEVPVSKAKCHRSIVCSGGEIIFIRLADQHTAQKQADRQTFRTAVTVEG